MKIAITTSSFARYSDEPLKLLEQAGVEYVMNDKGRALTEEEAIQILEGCHGVAAGTEPLTKKVMDALPDLKVISRCGTGMDNVDRAYAAEKGIEVRNTPDGPTLAVAELTLGLILTLLRQVPHQDRELRSGVWKKRMGNLLHGKNVGIVGFGKIGQAVAHLLEPFGVNVALMYRYAEEIMGVIMEERVPAVFTSAGSPKTWTARLHEAGCKVAHVISSTKFALKSQQAGVDAVVAEGFEAGGHNGREETTTMVLVPRVRQAVAIPLIAAGGIATGRGMLAAFALGAEGIQMGTRFALSEESSASDAFKKLCIGLQEGDTMLALKKLSPTRLIRNDFFRAVEEAENRGATAEELQQLLGRGRSKRGIFEGDLTDGELEIGQAASLIRELPTAGQIVRETVAEYEAGLQELVKQATNCKEEI